MPAQLASDVVLDEAYGWLCRRRRDYPADADVWSFRRHWRQEKRRIRDDLLAGRFCFGLLDRIALSDGSDIDPWSARDALVLKAMTIVLADILPVSPRCTHIKGHGGAKAAVRHVDAHLAANSFVMRTDVKSFYGLHRPPAADGPAGDLRQGSGCIELARPVPAADLGTRRLSGPVQHRAEFGIQITNQPYVKGADTQGPPEKRGRS